MDRREFLKLGAAAAAGPTVAGLTINPAGAGAPRRRRAMSRRSRSPNSRIE